MQDLKQHNAPGVVSEQIISCTTQGIEAVLSYVIRSQNYIQVNKCVSVPSVGPYDIRKSRV